MTNHSEIRNLSHLMLCRSQYMSALMALTSRGVVWSSRAQRYILQHYCTVWRHIDNNCDCIIVYRAHLSVSVEKWDRFWCFLLPLESHMIFHPCKYWLVHWKFPWLKDLSAQLIGHYVSALPLWMDTKDIIWCTWRVIHWQSFAIKVTRLIIPSLLFPVGGFFLFAFPSFFSASAFCSFSKCILPSLSPSHQTIQCTDNTSPVTSHIFNTGTDICSVERTASSYDAPSQDKRVLKEKDQRFL